LLAPVQVQDLLVEGQVALARRDHLQSELLLLQRGQNADRHQPRLQLLGHSAAVIPGLRQLLLQLPQSRADQNLGPTVDLDVEAGQFRHHQRIVHGLQVG